MICQHSRIEILRQIECIKLSEINDASIPTNKNVSLTGNGEAFSIQNLEI